MLVTPTLSGTAALVTLSITGAPEGVFVASLIHNSESVVPVISETSTTLASTSASVSTSPSATIEPEPLLAHGLSPYSIQIDFAAPALPLPGNFQGTLTLSWPGGSADVALGGTTALITATVATGEPIPLTAGGKVTVPVKVVYASGDSTTLLSILPPLRSRQPRPLG